MFIACFFVGTAVNISYDVCNIIICNTIENSVAVVCHYYFSVPEAWCILLVVF